TIVPKSAEIVPQNTDVRMRMGGLWLQEKLKDVAITEFLYVGKAYQRQGRAAEARTAFEKVLKLAPDHAEARRRLDSPYQPELDEPDPSATEAAGMTVADVVQGETVE